MTWRIRPAEKRDVGDLVAIEMAQFPEPWTKSMLLEEITNHESRRYTVAEENGVIVGYLGLMFVLKDELHVNTIGTRSGDVATRRSLGGGTNPRSGACDLGSCGLQHPCAGVVLPLRLRTGGRTKELLRKDS